MRHAFSRPTDLAQVRRQLGALLRPLGLAARDVARERADEAARATRATREREREIYTQHSVHSDTGGATSSHTFAHSAHFDTGGATNSRTFAHSVHLFFDTGPLREWQAIHPAGQARRRDERKPKVARRLRRACTRGRRHRARPPPRRARRPPPRPGRRPSPRLRRPRRRARRPCACRAASSWWGTRS